MNRRMFHKALNYSLVAVFFLSSACSSLQKGTITRQQVSAFLNDMDQAAQRKDVEAIVDRISRTAQFKIKIEGFGPTQTMSLNRDQYRDYSNQGLSVAEAYDHKRGDTVINIDPDGQTAFVADEVFETATIQGRVIRTVTRGTATLKLEDGNLVITSGESIGRPAQSTPTSSRTSFQ